MPSGNVSDQPMVELFCSLVAQRASGRLEVRDGKRKRAFWFEGGRLALTRSNLKSETAERIEELNPGISGDDLAREQVRVRLVNAIETPEGEWEFTANEPPPERQPADVVELLVAVVKALPMPRVEARLAGLRQRNPRRAQSPVVLTELRLASGAAELLKGLDGERTLDEILEFAPGDPDECARAIYLAMAFGMVRFGEKGAGLAEVEAHGSAPPPQSASYVVRRPGGVITPPAARPAEDEDPDLARLQREKARVDAAESHFAVLDVHWDADEGTFRKAYFKAAQELHPDRWTARSSRHAELAESVFARVAEAWEVLGDAKARQAYIDKVVHGKKTEDELAMEQVQAILSAEAEFKLGYSALQVGRMVQAHDHFNKAVQRYSDEPEFRAYLGYTTFKMNWPRNESAAAEGEAMLRKAIEVGKKMDGPQVLLALVAKQKGDTDLAIRLLQLALRANPANVDAARELRRMQQEAARPKEAPAGGGIGGLLGGLFGKKK